MNDRQQQEDELQEEEYNQGVTEFQNHKRTKQLQNRLYDKGFNQMTLPSVQRNKLQTMSVNVKRKLDESAVQKSFQQKDQNNAKLMRATLMSFQQRENKLEPIKFQKQSVALHQEQQEQESQKGKRPNKKQLQSNSSQQFQSVNHHDQNQSDKLKMGETQNYSKFGTMSKTAKHMNSTQTFFKNGMERQQMQSQGNQLLATKEMFQENQIDYHNMMHKTSSLFNLPQLQHKPKELIPQLGSTITSDFNFSSDNFFLDKARSQPQDFEPKEYKRTKYLVDKISGKFNIDKRYRESSHKKKRLQAIQQEIQEEEELQKQQQQQKPSNKKQRCPKLDIYIEYILKGVSNIEEYIYLVRANEDDPYNLDVSSYDKIKKMEGLKEYYIISRKGLCHYVNDKPVEFIALALWLKERETYDEIIALNFFTKFRKWKTLKMWRKNVIKEKTQKYAKDLKDKLFILNDILRKTLLEFRRDTHSMMESVRFINLDAKDKLLNDDSTYTLEQFKQKQEKQRQEISTQIQEFSKNCRKTVSDGFEASLNLLKKNQYMNNQNDDDMAGQKKGNQNFFRLKESAYENLGFADNMTYEKRSELRKECSKFLRFSYLVDFIALESLSQIYTLSCGELKDKLCELTNEEEDQDGDKGVSEDPLFSLTLDHNFDEIENQFIEIEQIKEFEPPPGGNSLDIEFNPLYHIKIKRPEDEEQTRDDQEQDDEKLIDRRIVPKITELWLRMAPDREAFSRDIVKCITEGRQSIQCFERWSRSDDMTKYVSVLEEWDDHVGNAWQNPESPYLNPSEWIDQQDQDVFQYTYKPLIDKAFDKCDEWKRTSLHPFLINFWELQQFDLEQFKDYQDFDNIGWAFEKTLTQLNNFKEINETKLPNSVELGLFKIETEKLRQKLLPEPEKKIDILKKMMPTVLKDKMSEVKQWMQQKFLDLKVESKILEDFVDQQEILKNISDIVRTQKYSIQYIVQILGILKKFNFEFSKEQSQNFQDTSVVKKLDEAIQKAEENAPKRKEIYSKDIKNNMVPNLRKAVNELSQQVAQEKYIQDKLTSDQAIKELNEFKEEMNQQIELGRKYNRYEEILELDNITQYEELDTLKLDLNAKYDMWDSSQKWKAMVDKWMTCQFNDIKNEKIQEQIQFFDKIVRRCDKQLQPNVVPIIKELKDSIQEFKNQMPIVKSLRNEKMNKIHWQQITDKIGQELDVTASDFTLQKMIDLNLGKFSEEIVEISTQATQENKLKIAFQDVEQKWKDLMVETSDYQLQGRGQIKVLAKIDDLNIALDEILANMNNILGSRYLKQLRNAAEALQRNVLNAQDTLSDWVQVQKNWMYLENLFTSPEIKSTLKSESQDFEKVDQFFRKQMANVEQKPYLHQIIDKNSKRLWEQNKDSLNNIQSALDQILETKRNVFPRFYFLSNDELLEIMANSEIESVEKNLKKCFDGIFRVRHEGTLINAMISPEGEVIDFKSNVQVQGSVEQWLASLETRMRTTIRDMVKKSKSRYEDKVKTTETKQQWVKEEKAQVLATVDNIMWTNYTEDSLFNLENGEPSALYNWAYNTFPGMLRELTDLVASNTLNKLQHKSIVALITQDVHARDILKGMVDQDVTSKQDFIWQKELRYYIDDSDGTVTIKQVNAQIKYGNEYYGATSRLVITKLTDRCWMTITGALNIQLGAAPAGPAGTGKTESTKDLGKALGQYCIVFNCSDQIEYKMMQRLFAGLCEQGAWACLDEFNRIDIEVLSVVAQQLQTIRSALVRNVEQFPFGDQEKQIQLKRDGYGVFITMNPGYAGRTELPDNLKVLFRPVAMMIPDYGIIAQIMLMAEGFSQAVQLSQKMVQLYKLSSEQLSQQDHYDFGMRAVKSVLNMAGSLKRSNPKMDESIVLIRAMRDSNIPKFLKQDLPLFQALILDLFPNISIPDPNYGELPEQIRLSIAALNLQYKEELATKVVQLYETFNVRFGVMLVGQTNSAKTECFKILQHAMTKLSSSEVKGFARVNLQILNPKSISMGELYGEVNIWTQEWTDGLASQIMREGADLTGDDNLWVVFDGPVDALWIENMNTVLDDNKMLCLANGQRIKLRDEMRMLFEVQDLKVASPATVSRCGMVYLMYEDIGWQPYVKSWIERVYNNSTGNSEYENYVLSADEAQAKELRDYIYSLFEKSVDNFLELKQDLVEPIQTVDLQIVQSLCNMFECFLFELPGMNKRERFEDKKRFINHIFTFSFVWSMCVTCDEKHYRQIDAFVKESFPSTLFPTQGYVYSYYLDPEELLFKSWDNRVEEEKFEYDPSQQFFEILVPTVDTVRFSYVLEYLLNKKKHVYVTGISGIGKSVICQGKLVKVKETRSIDHFQIIFSAQTSSMNTQLTIESKLTKTSKKLLSAKPTRKNCIFIDDVNMPSVEEYGAQPPIELLRLLVDKKGLYDRKERFWKDVTEFCLLLCSAPPGGGRSNITQRFTRHFNILSLPQPNNEVLNKIFETILKGFLEKKKFKDQVKHCADGMVRGTIEVYKRIMEEKKPIPSKFHYTFNLRDVSKVFMGITMVSNYRVKDEVTAAKLWVHENMRVFHDRLIDQIDREWFYELMMEILGREFKAKLEKDQIFYKDVIYFTDIHKLDGDPNQRFYELITEAENKKLMKTLVDQLDNYNQEHPTKMNLVFFSDCISHILRISRILRSPRGSAMLIGVGGSGKQSLTKLSTFMLGYTLQMLEAGQLFRDFLKDTMKLVVDPKVTAVTFLFTDTQIQSEGQLEDINNILNSGEVPNLWNQDEKQQVQELATDYNTSKKRDAAPDTIYKSFVEKVRNDYHIVLCMSPVGDALRVRCRKFPSLVDCCGLDWFSPWPADALFSVAKSIFEDTQDFPTPQSCDLENLIVSLANMCKLVHQTATDMTFTFEEQLKRKVYTTPKSYLDHIKLYIQKLEEVRDSVKSQKDKLAGGVDKLKSAKDKIAGLQIDLKELEPKLIEKTKEVEEFQKQLNKDKEIADEKELVVQEEVDKVQIQTDEVEVIKNDAERDLKQIQPILDEATAAVKNIDQKELVNLRGMANPPAIVVTVFEAVCVLFEEKKTDWPTSQRLLQNLNQFIQNLKEKQNEVLKKSVRAKLKTLVNKEIFNPEVIKNKVSYAADIAKFCKAMDVYSEVKELILPKQHKVEELNKKLEISNKALQIKKDQLATEKAKVEALNQEVQLQIKTKQALDDQKKRTTLQLTRADKLILLTADESIRWQKTVEILKEKLENLFGDVFLCVAGISYNGPLTGIYRNELIEKWGESLTELGIPWSEKYDIVNTLGDPIVIRDWMIKGLPSDSVSQENSIFTEQSYRWPLLIDPQLQARKWIINKEFDETAEVPTFLILKFEQTDFQRKMELAISNGYSVLIQDVDDNLHPSIDAILSKNFYNSPDGETLIKYGDKECTYDKRFRLFLMTKKPNPNYLAEVYIKVNVINFTATFEGLNDQLLALVVANEQPQVEKDRDQNIRTIARLKRQIEECENMILNKLKTTEAEDMLDDDELIDKLELSKKSAETSAKQMKESEADEVRINKIRNDYKVVALRGAILYFVIKDLALVDPMYQYSLQAITRLFKFALQNSDLAPDDLPQRLENLINKITQTMYSNVCRGLFEAHKLVYSFLISTSINKNSQILDPSLFSVLLKGADMVDHSAMPANPDPKRISSIQWELAFYLDQNYEKFKGFVDHVINKFKAWSDFITCENPLTKGLPDKWNDNLDIFEKMMVIKIFRPEKIMFAISNYVHHYMGQFYLEPPSTVIQNLYEDSDKSTPIIFVLSQGADPTSQIEQFAKQMNMEQKLKRISLGQGQGEKAKKLIDEDGRQDGCWIFLQNCHLDKTFMPRLELIVNKFDEDKDKEGEIHNDFRLFLTSMPAPYFPVAVLQAGIKVTNEPPRGIRANLKRSWATIDEEFLIHQEKGTDFAKLVWGLSYFHAIIQERRKFGPLGWNIRYEFNDSDLECSVLVMRNLLKESNQIPWDSLKFVSGHINYGGRVTDDWDRRCLITILSKFYVPDILNNTYEFSSSSTYYIPETGPVESYRDVINKLPLQDDPAVFGMHENANITYQNQESTKILNTVLSIQPRSATGDSGKTPDQIILDKIETILEQLPDQLIQADGNQEQFETNDEGLIPSLSTVLLQEITKFNSLLGIISTTLKHLQMAIGGQMVMSSELDAVYTSMLNNQVPSRWQRYPSLKPLTSWMADLQERVKFMKDWLVNGNPVCYWLSGLFFPQGFLTGVLQTHARKTQIAIDQLEYQFRILAFEKEQCTVKPTDGVYIYGLFMEGAQFERKGTKQTITDSMPGIMTNTMPVICFTPTKIPDADMNGSGGGNMKKLNNYECPVYKTSVRAGVLSTTGQSTNFVLKVDIPNLEQDEEYWIQRGAAMLCQEDV